MELTEEQLATAPAPEKPGFRFHIGERVGLIESDERGVVIARAEYATSENGYLVRYCAGDHRMTEAWWGESALSGQY